MEIKRFEEIKKNTEVFGFGKLQDLMTLYVVLRKEKISLRELEDYLKYKQRVEKQREEEASRSLKEVSERWNRNAKRCPLCNRVLNLRPITEPVGRLNVQGYKSHWYCLTEDCIYEEYSKIPYKDLYLKIMGDV